MHDVFVSFSFKDEKSAEYIVNQLTNIYNIKCWICTHDIRGGENYKDKIYNAIKESKVVVFLQSENSIASDEVPKEIANALKLNKLVIPFILDESKLVGGLAYDLENVLKIDGTKPEFDDRIKDLANTVYSFIDKYSEPSTNHRIGKSKLFRSNYGISNSQFIGRSQELDDIKKNLKNSRIAFLYGVGGCGKTQLVKRYIDVCKQSYDDIIFAVYETSIMDMITSDTYFLLDEVKRSETESNEEFFNRKLEAIKDVSSERTLFIIDNFDCLADEHLENLLNGPYQIILTTRVDYSYLGLPMILVDSLEPEEQLALFLAGYKKTISNEEKGDVKKILSMVCGHTLTIELISKLMFSKRIKPKEMIKYLEEVGIAPSVKGTIRHGFDKPDTLYGHISTLFSFEKLKDYEVQLLLDLSIMPVSGIMVDDFLEFSNTDDFEIIDSLIERSWIKYNSDEDRLSLHPVISDVVKNKCLELQLQVCDDFIFNLAKRFHNAWSMKNDERLYFGEIAKSVYRKMPEHYFYNINICDSLLQVFSNLDMFDLSREVLRIMNDNWGHENTLESAWVNCFLGDYCLRYQYYDQAIEYMDKAISIVDSLEKYPYDLAYFTKHLSHIYHAKYYHNFSQVELLENALDCLDKSNECFLKAIGSNSTQFGSYCYSFGKDMAKDNDRQQASRDYAYGLNKFYSKDYDSSIEYSNKSYLLFKEVNGEEDPDTTAPMRVLARAYSKKGWFDDAIDMENKVIKIRERLWGIDNFRYFEQLETLADIYFENNKTHEGLKCLRKLLECVGNKKELFSFYVDKINRKIEQYSQ